ncbi:hypothetical protein [Acetobacter malorum]|uniref:hypothetical protein n=1 Tax=Acetobacter malorum TaxID=178901 RepID=UPI0012E97016|nr:hypothetical protein [Acetobacter malorum]
MEKSLYFLLTVIVAFPSFSTLLDEPEGGKNFTTNQQPKSVLLLTNWLPAGSQHEVFFGALHQKHGIVPSFSLFDLFNIFVMLFMSFSCSFWLLTKLSFSFFKNDLITPQKASVSIYLRL